MASSYLGIVTAVGIDLIYEGIATDSIFFLVEVEDLLLELT